MAVTHLSPISQFLSLPAELRNHIYEILFANSITRIHSVPTADKTHFYFTFQPTPTDNPTPGLPSLLATTHQLRTESLAIFLATTTWTATSEMRFTRSDPSFLAMIRKLGAADHLAQATKLVNVLTLSTAEFPAQAFGFPLVTGAGRLCVVQKRRRVEEMKGMGVEVDGRVVEVVMVNKFGEVVGSSEEGVGEGPTERALSPVTSGS